MTTRGATKRASTPPAPAALTFFQTPQEQLELLESVASGDVSVAALLGMSQADLDALARVAATSFAARRFEVAAKYFAALASLQPRNPIHVLHLADSHVAAGRVPEALEALGRFLSHPVPGEKADQIRALELRVVLLAPTDRAEATADLERAHALRQE